ncbi:MAG TPA: hypothetical protein VH062_15680 [Polyangiaceae bacterium]|jgi:hypothetical protein|nr:hypothetical protein [Polyangiaceae bacterium]
MNRPEGAEERLRALGQLAGLLCDDASVAGELVLAWNEPDRYTADHGERLGDRGIDAPTRDLAFIALVDALRERKRCIEIDWRADPGDMVKAVRALLRQYKRTGWKTPKLDDGEELETLLRVVGSSIAATGLSLCSLDHQSDSYALVLLPSADVDAAIELARSSEVGQVAVWRKVDAIVEPEPPVRLRTIATFDGESPAPPHAFFALPRRRAVAFDGAVLSLVSADGTGHLALDRELLPDFDAAAARPEHVLVRSGQHFGLASREFVRLWSPSGESVLYRNDPPVASEVGELIGETGGISDDPAVVITGFRSAGAETNDIRVGVFRLSSGKKKMARFELLDTPHSGALAWLDDARYEQRLALDELHASRVSSSFAHLLVTHRQREGGPASIFSLAPPSSLPRVLELPPGATLLDEEADGFWYFEPAAPHGRYVLAEAIGP